MCGIDMSTEMGLGSLGEGPRESSVVLCFRRAGLKNSKESEGLIDGMGWELLGLPITGRALSVR
jgi:hypothetical protein